ncbi:MAG TPA: pyruvate kinase [Vicinamibacterales bacterium]|nr:pyruvate kinase [Vicinamibacterales bacterium]
MPDLLPHDHPATRAQIVATLGPRSLPLAAALAAAGATAFRLNASHLRPAALAAALARTRDACPETPIVVDLQGAKMRLGWIESRTVSPGDRVRFGPGGDPAVSLPHPELYRDIRPGQVLSVDDGRLRLEVLEAGPTSIEARAVTAGTLEPRKGVNVERHPVHLQGLTPSDVEALSIGAMHAGVAFAFSFMSTGREAAWVREAVPGAAVAGKVERDEAVQALPALASLVDAVWVCRGDLGAQLGLDRLARVVAAIDPRAYPCPVLLAGQVLQHLVEHAEPTRSEVCHLYDMMARGYAGIVLSDETAVGRDPVRAVRVAAALLAASG